MNGEVRVGVDECRLVTVVSKANYSSERVVNFI